MKRLSIGSKVIITKEENKRFTKDMGKYKGKEAIVTGRVYIAYRLDIDEGVNYWFNDMLLEVENV